MIEKNKILTSWIMVEHLSEGDIRCRDKAVLTLNDLQDQNFYDLFWHEIEKKNGHRYKKGGIVVYFDIFAFQEVVDILRKQYGLKPTDEEIHLGDKFSFALYFDRKLSFLADMTFFTVSAYIRIHKEVPDEKTFRRFELDFKNQLVSLFDETDRDPKKFNEAIQHIFYRYRIDLTSCRMQVLRNIENEATNLHSFFIDDLEKTKKIETTNLNAYLYGWQKQRLNLDSKKASDHFHPRLFEQILQPKHYPLGRFPNKTAYALSLMQQVAVNLSIGYDDNQMRSVNGPPGTGKTTLLKDIFAELIVRQAYDVAKLSNHLIKGTKQTAYFDQASIGELPEYITENHIVVASTNNGAVQNIVNELPLIKEIDSSLFEELKAADYFYELANAKLTSEWIKDKNGKHREVLRKEPSDEEKYWGIFSLEGGKADNMMNIITHIKHIYQYLDNNYHSNQEIYQQFLAYVNEVKALRTQKQFMADRIQTYREDKQKLAQACTDYQIELAQNEQNLNTKLRQLAEKEQEYQRQLEQLMPCLLETQSKAEMLQTNMTNANQLLQMQKHHRPHFFAGKQRKEEYRSQLKKLSEQQEKLHKEDRSYRKKLQQIQQDILLCQTLLKQDKEKQNRLHQEFDHWKQTETDEIARLKARVSDNEKMLNDHQCKMLDMNQEYDDLQLSNPWFDEAYRIAQSKLFILALRVRKQFLYENRKNIKAAADIWMQQEKYLERKRVIKAAWNWMNMTIPVISSTFASFSRMGKNLGVDTLGHLFIDEAGQALPQAAVGAIWRSRHVMALGDPSQIKPVLTLDANILTMLGQHFGVSEKYLSTSSSVQSLVDAASQYGFYRKQDQTETSWIGIPLWVHRRCRYPMFTISNLISYDGFMVQGLKKYGKAEWFDVGGTANNKYVEAQGEFLCQKLSEMIEKNPKIIDENEKDLVYVITPFTNVAYQLSRKLHEINFTRYNEQKKPTNIGTVHTFQGKEAPIVFFVLGADQQSRGAALWAVSEANIMNVAVTRAKEEFYIIGDRNLYLQFNCDVVNKTDQIISFYQDQYHEDELTDESGSDMMLRRMSGTVKYVGKGTTGPYAYVDGVDGNQYTISEIIYNNTEQAKKVIQKGNKISFVPEERTAQRYATKVKVDG